MLREFDCFIYGLRCKVTSKIYTGSTIQPHEREFQHRNSLRQGKHKNEHLQNAWNKYGEDTFEFFIIEEIYVEDRKVKEQFWMDYLKSSNPKFGFNADHVVRTLPVAPIRSKIMKDYWDKPGTREKASQDMIDAWANNNERLLPAVTQNALNLQERLKNEPELKQKCVDGIKKSHGRPEFRAKHSIILIEAWEDKDLLTRQSEIITAQHRDDPELKSRRLAGFERQRQEPNFHENKSKETADAWKRMTLEDRQKRIAGLLKYLEAKRQEKLQNQILNNDIVQTDGKPSEVDNSIEST